MKWLIVNADDFGLTVGVNQAILDGHLHGIISSTSLLANGEAFDSAVTLLQQAASLSVGVHLNLTEGKPVAAACSIPSLLNSQGLLTKTAGSLWRGIIFRQVSALDIEKEFRAQIEKVLAAGIVPSHLNGHKHVHALPCTRKITMGLAREYGIPAVRCVAERQPTLGGLLRRFPRAVGRLLRQHLGSRALAAMSAGWAREIERAGLICSSHFYGLTPTGFLDETLLRHLLCHLPDGTSELMCHPGFVDSALRRTPTRLLEQREAEYRALTHPAMKLLIRDLGIQIVNYRDIASSLGTGTSPDGKSNGKQVGTSADLGSSDSCYSQHSHLRLRMPV